MTKTFRNCGFVGLVTLAGCTALPASSTGWSAVSDAGLSDAGDGSSDSAVPQSNASPAVLSISPAAAIRNVRVPVIIRGVGFVTGAAVSIRSPQGGLTQLTNVRVIDSQTVTANVPARSNRVLGTYDVLVTQRGQRHVLPRRLNVVNRTTSPLPPVINFPFRLTAALSPWLVRGVVSVQDGGSLTIEPGATVLFETPASRIDVGVSSVGTFSADGGNQSQAGRPIVFSALSAVSGLGPANYDGLRFGPNAGASVLRNVLIEYAGAPGGLQAAVEMQAQSTLANFTDSILRDSIQTGLHLGASAGSFSGGSAWFDRNELVRVGTGEGQYPISLAADVVGTLGADLRFETSGSARINLRAGDIARGDAQGQHVYRNYGLPYVATGDIRVVDGATLVLEPGTTLRFPSGAGLVVSPVRATLPRPGGLIVNGQNAAVTVSSIDDATTFRGIEFGSDVLPSSLSGLNLTGFQSIGIRVSSPRVAAPNLTLFNSQVQSAAPNSVGVYLERGARVERFEGNRIDTAGLSINAFVADIHTALSDSGTYATPIEVRGGVIEQSTNPMDQTVWRRPHDSGGNTTPIRINSAVSISGTSLQIQAGNLLELGRNALFDVWSGTTPGRLVMSGQADARIVIRPLAGPKWGAIRFVGALPQASHLAYVDLVDAGFTSDVTALAPTAAIHLGCMGQNCAAPIVEHVRIRNSNGYGVYFADGATCTDCSDVSIEHSVLAALEVGANDAGFIGTDYHFQQTGSAIAGHENVVRVRGGVVERSQSWPAHSIPYLVLDRVSVRGRTDRARSILTLAAGSQLRFVPRAGLYVGEILSGYASGGDMVIDGTTEAPVLLTNNGLSDSGTALHWLGVHYQSGSTSASFARFATVRFGGTRDAANINIDLQSRQPGPRFDNVTLSDSLGYAGYVGSSDRVSFTNMSYSGNMRGNCVYVRNAPSWTCVPAPSYTP